TSFSEAPGATTVIVVAPSEVTSALAGASTSFSEAPGATTVTSAFVGASTSFSEAPGATTVTVLVPSAVTSALSGTATAALVEVAAFVNDAA
ncbi:hypothetical protein PENSPDRAFT_690191, partial [Peniophora sp. CONT]